MSNSMVNHPVHYQRKDRPECIEEMVSLYGVDITTKWAILTCQKYVYRCGMKDEIEQELAKIKWYETWIEKHLALCDISTEKIYRDYKTYKQEVENNVKIS